MNCQNLRLSVDDFEGIGRFALENGIALVVVGPELPLSWESQTTSSKVWWYSVPTRAGAQIEASKSWAKL